VADFITITQIKLSNFHFGTTSYLQSNTAKLSVSSAYVITIKLKLASLAVCENEEICMATFLLFL
jgi:hypothetical protein